MSFMLCYVFALTLPSYHPILEAYESILGKRYLTYKLPNAVDIMCSKVVCTFTDT